NPLRADHSGRHRIVVEVLVLVACRAALVLFQELLVELRTEDHRIVLIPIVLVHIPVYRDPHVGNGRLRIPHRLTRAPELLLPPLLPRVPTPGAPALHAFFFLRGGCPRRELSSPRRGGECARPPPADDVPICRSARPSPAAHKPLRGKRLIHQLARFL